MKKMSNRSSGSSLFLALLLAHGAVNAAEPKEKSSGGSKQAPVEMSAIRVQCEGKAANSEVSVNGVLKGECPLDMEVKPGLIQITAVQKRDDYYEQVFEQSFTLGGGVAKRVEVVFNKRALFRPDVVARIDKAVEASEMAMEAKRRSEIPALESAAAGGDGAAMTRLARFYGQGLAGGVDMKKSIEWCKKGAEAGNAEAMYDYGRLLEQGTLVPKNVALAIEFYQKSARLGEPRALQRIGMSIAKGSDGFQKDTRLAGTYYMKAAEAGSKLSALMYWGTLPEEEKDAGLATEDKLSAAATKIVLQKAEAGEDFDALTDAASTYIFGVYGNAKNPERALTYYRMALRQKKKQAAAGDAEAAYQLGYWSADQGLGFRADKNEAIRYYKLAQKLGYPDAAAALSKLQSN